MVEGDSLWFYAAKLAVIGLASMQSRQHFGVGDLPLALPLILAHWQLQFPGLTDQRAVAGTLGP